MQSLRERHRDELASLCCEQYRVELDVQLTHGPALRCRLEQLLAAARDTCQARLTRGHDAEVTELKKKLDAQNWEEMKALARRHRDKSELARYRLKPDDDIGVVTVTRFFVKRTRHVR